MAILPPEESVGKMTVFARKNAGKISERIFGSIFLFLLDMQVTYTTP